MGGSVSYACGGWYCPELLYGRDAEWVSLWMALNFNLCYMEPNKGNKRRTLETELFLLKLKALRLRQVWMYSDSQPTEIVLAMANIFLAPLALSIELGASLFFSLIPMLSGIYQIICVASDDIDCRVRASMVTFGIYSASAVMYAITIGFPSPTHYGWLIFVIASFGSMSRLSREKIYRNNG